MIITAAIRTNLDLKLSKARLADLVSILALEEWLVDGNFLADGTLEVRSVQFQGHLVNVKWRLSHAYEEQQQ